MSTLVMLYVPVDVTAVSMGFMGTAHINIISILLFWNGIRIVGRNKTF